MWWRLKNRHRSLPRHTDDSWLRSVMSNCRGISKRLHTRSKYDPAIPIVSLYTYVYSTTYLFDKFLHLSDYSCFLNHHHSDPRRFLFLRLCLQEVTTKTLPARNSASPRLRGHRRRKRQPASQVTTASSSTSSSINSNNRNRNRGCYGYRCRGAVLVQRPAMVVVSVPN